jgi:hypothetical protein
MTRDASPPHSPGAVSDSHGHDDPHANPEVRYERSDVEAGGIVTFVVVLAAVILLSGVLLAVLFRSYQDRAVEAFGKDALPLARSDSDRLPVAPRLEGIDPADDAGRAWPGTSQAEGALPWFGYNVRVVPANGAGSDAMDGEERDRVAALSMARKLRKIDATISALADKLPARPLPAGPLPDVFRRSAGESNSGRSAGEGSP